MRWPEVIMEVNCTCQSCYLPCEASDGCPTGKCTPVMKEMAVLRRKGCVDDFYRYEWDKEMVSVACECVLTVQRPPFQEVCSLD